MRPSTVEEVAQAIGEASGPLYIKGGGTCAICAPQDAQVLDMSGLSGVTLYEPEAMTLVAKAGTPVAEIEALLAAHGQHLAFEPWDARRLMGSAGVPTIGGVVASNASGPRRMAPSGACRDAVLGVQFVDGMGRAVRNGGRVMKNVTGYDLSKMQSGAHGTLGVLTEVSLKVLPAPARMVTLHLEDVPYGQLIQAMSAGINTPFEISGAASVRLGAQSADLAFRLEGEALSVAYRADALRHKFAGFGQLRICDDLGAQQALWADIRDAAPLANAHSVVRVSVRPSFALGLIALAPDLDWRMDWGGGRLWAGLDEGAPAIVARLRSYLDQHRAGHATLIKGQGAPRFHPEPVANAILASGLRKRFDPKGVLNRGLMDAGSSEQGAL